jgi:hypothetical protein
MRHGYQEERATRCRRRYHIDAGGDLQTIISTTALRAAA